MSNSDLTKLINKLNDARNLANKLDLDIVDDIEEIIDTVQFELEDVE